MKPNLSWLRASLLFAACTASCTALAEDPSTALEWAELLVDTIDPAYNSYDSDAYVYWEGYDGHTISQVRAMCSPFMAHLLVRAYKVDMKSWMGCNVPLSATYHDTIVAENGFKRITNIHDVLPGDIVAVSYLDAGCEDLTCGSYSFCTSTGHTSLVAGVPKLRAVPSEPFVWGTLQYEVLIIDSASGVHGPFDTRYEAEADGSHDSGVGRGTMRIYTDTSGVPVGYTWSTFSYSEFYPMSDRHLVIGRYDGSYDDTGS